MLSSYGIHALMPACFTRHRAGVAGGQPCKSCGAAAAAGFAHCKRWSSALILQPATMLPQLIEARSAVACAAGQPRHRALRRAVVSPS